MTSCWHQACSNTEGCIATLSCKDNTSTNITFLNELCPISPSNATLFDFGIFLDAVESGNTGPIYFSRKFFFTFWWGIRNLRFVHMNTLSRYIQKNILSSISTSSLLFLINFSIEYWFSHSLFYSFTLNFFKIVCSHSSFVHLTCPKTYRYSMPKNVW